MTALRDFRLAVVSDAAPERNGVGAYYQDLVDSLAGRVGATKIFSPTIVNGVWEAGLVLPMPGDDTQKLCFPNPFALRRALRSFSPDAIIVPTPGLYGMEGAVLGFRWGIPVIAGFHTSFEQLTSLYWQNSLKGRFYTQYLERSHKFLFRRSARVLVNSEDMFALALRMGSDNIVRVGTPLPVSFSRHPAVAYSGEVRRIVFAGRLAAEKNIEAVIALAQSHPLIEINVAGDGPLHSMVAREADNMPNLNFLGWLGRDALRDEIDRNDVLVLPSHFESFGTIALEAMSRGRIVIVSSGTGISDWPELTPGLVVIATDEQLSDSVTRVQKMTIQQRGELALAAKTAALSFDARNLSEWEQLLEGLTDAG